VNSLGSEMPVPPVFRLTVLGTGTAAPEAGTAASGLLIETADTAVVFDCGSGVAARVQEAVGAERLSAVVIGHQHADHWIDLAPLRYQFAWGERSSPRLPVYLPPGGSERLVPLAFAIAERPTFFLDAFDVREYASETPFEVGSLSIRPVEAQHYVPAWSMEIMGPGGGRIVYGGDMGPTEGIVELGRGADLLILEATLETPVGDDPRRGHLTTEEAIDIAVRSAARRTLLVHYRTDRRDVIGRLCADSGANVAPAVPMMQVELGR
jgi:ribonuclease BN (tRNA processing enzyme)